MKSSPPAEAASAPRTVHIAPSSPESADAKKGTDAGPSAEDIKRSIEILVDGRLRSLEASLERLVGLVERTSGASNPLADSVLAEPAVASRSLALQEVLDAPSPSIPGRSVTAPTRVSPLLERLAPTPRVERILLAWAAELLADVGREGLPEALAHMENSGWIAASVRERLSRLAAGMKVDGLQPRADWRLSPAMLDRSLGHVEELLGHGVR